MKSVSRILFVLIVTLLLGACALSPQTINIHPAIDTANLARPGNGKVISLDIVDSRGTAVVGTRGGVYARTSEIRTAADVKPAVRDELSKALQAMGYRVSPPAHEQEADASLAVIMDTINYKTVEKTVGKTIEIAVTVRVLAKNVGREYQGRYRGKRTTDVLKSPDAAENEEMINEAISHVLERVLADSELHEFMRS